MPLLSWFRGIPAAGRSRGPSQTRVCRMCVQIQPLLLCQPDPDLILSTSFTPLQDIARPGAPALRHLLPPRTTHHQPLRIAPPAGTIQKVLGALASEAVSVSDEPGDNKVCVVARQDTWSRSARRKARRAAIPNADLLAGEKGTEGGCGTEGDHGRSQRPVLLVAHVWVEEFAGERDAGESKGWQLVVQWKRGHDVQAFEGFASHVGRKMREATEAEAEVVQI